MRPPALLCLAFAAPILLAGCTGTGVFLDHTFDWFGDNPNTPAGNSEMFQRLRGEPTAFAPLLPESGNVWPGPQAPDPTMQELQQQQNSGGPPSVGGGTDHQQPRPPGYSPQGAPPSVVQPGSPPGNLVRPPRQGRSGESLDVTGGSSTGGYRHLQAPPPGRGILVPNGNGTSTLIGPDGSVSTVPTKP